MSRGAASSRLLLLAGLLAGAGCGAPDTPTTLPAAPGSQLPHLAADVHGRPVLSWVEDAPSGHRLVYAVLGKRGWQDPVTVATGSNWFVNWADFPSVEPLTETLWAAHWLVKQPGGMYAYDVALAVSGDAGRTWSAPWRPHDDDTATEHGFVSLWPAALPDGATGVGALWLDGRYTLVDPSRTAAREPRMTLRAAVFDRAGHELTETEVDPRVCDCCQTDVAVTATGVLAAYRGRSREEVRDIYVARLDGGGPEAPVKVADDGWVIGGCPVNGPAIDAAAGAAVVAWYTEATGTREVRIARRRGETWSPPQVVDRGDVLGRVDVQVLPGGDAAVLWMGDARNGRARVKLARFDSDGRLGSPLVVAETSAMRPAGFPRLLAFDDSLLIAWTAHEGDVPRVATTHLAVSALPSGRPGEIETLSSAAAYNAL